MRERTLDFDEALTATLTGYDAIWGGPKLGVAWAHMKTRRETLEIDVQLMW
jgi:hypothetical protein